jgi:hypothetical protein
MDAKGNPDPSVAAEDKRATLRKGNYMLPLSATHVAANNVCRSFKSASSNHEYMNA